MTIRVTYIKNRDKQNTHRKGKLRRKIKSRDRITIGRPKRTVIEHCNIRNC